MSRPRLRLAGKPPADAAMLTAKAPPVDRRYGKLILRLARENSNWGYVRIVGELCKLGITVSATLVGNVLARAGVPPAPERGASSWRSFLRHHGNTILAYDFFTVETAWLAAVRALLRHDRDA